MLHVLALFAEIDLFKDWFPNVTNCKIEHKVTNYRGMYACQQSMPWGMWPRDMIFSATGMLDRQNVAVLTVIKSIDEGETFFGVPAPKTTDGHVRLDIKRGYHYFQMLDESRTRYVTIFNTDPKLTYMPGWFMNYVMTKVCYQMLQLAEEKSKEVANNIYGERLKEKKDFYGKLEEFIEYVKAHPDEFKLNRD